MKPRKTRPLLRRCVLGSALALMLAACGGSDPFETPPPLPQDVRISAVWPALHAGTLSMATAGTLRNEWRLPDGLSAEAYCVLSFRQVRQRNGRGYDLTLAFSARDQSVLRLVLHEPESGWWVAAVQSAQARAAVDLARRRVQLHAVQSDLAGDDRWQAELSGSFDFPPHPDRAECGSP